MKITGKISRVRFGQTIVYETRVGGTFSVKWEKIIILIIDLLQLVSLIRVVVSRVVV